MLINVLYAVDTLYNTMHINGIMSTAMHFSVLHNVVQRETNTCVRWTSGMSSSVLAEYCT